MIWMAPPEKDAATETLERRLWSAADPLRANSGLKAQEDSGPILGIIFLRFAEVRFSAKRASLVTLAETARPSRRSLGDGERIDDPAAYHAEGILYLAPHARFEFLLHLPEASDIGAKVNEAMRDIEKLNPPFNVNAVDNQRLKDSVGPARQKALPSFALPAAALLLAGVSERFRGCPH